MGITFEILIVLLLVVLNGLFSMSELALVSVRRARLAVLEHKGVSNSPNSLKNTANLTAIFQRLFLTSVRVKPNIQKVIHQLSTIISQLI